MSNVKVISHFIYNSLLASQDLRRVLRNKFDLRFEINYSLISLDFRNSIEELTFARSKTLGIFSRKVIHMLHIETSFSTHNGLRTKGNINPL